jgi:hypothetical protein
MNDAASSPTVAPAKPRRRRAPKPTTPCADRPFRRPRGVTYKSLCTTFAEWVALPPEERPPLIVGDGMGIDSTAVLVKLWKMGVRPDAITHADTGDEHPHTVAYREYRNAWLRSIGFPELTIVRRHATTSRKTGMVYATLGQNCIANETAPSIATGGKGCSIKWKIKPQEAWTKSWTVARDAWERRGVKVVKIIGYDAGPKDSRRAHEITNDKLFEYIYPLREWKMTREDCIALIRAAGVKVPRKSSCYFCTAMKPWELAEVVRDFPEIADYIMVVEAAALKTLRTGGLWRHEIKGKRDPLSAHPVSMTEFILDLRAHPEKLARLLAIAPVEADPIAEVIEARKRLVVLPG